MTKLYAPNNVFGLFIFEEPDKSITEISEIIYQTKEREWINEWAIIVQ
jgi:hypothetical protein